MRSFLSFSFNILAIVGAAMAILEPSELLGEGLFLIMCGLIGLFGCGLLDEADILERLTSTPSEGEA